MSEEIIIDGVNVAECEFLRYCVIPDNEGCKIDDSLCCDVGNCYYKQLKRLQAENEQLKEENSKIVWDEVCTTNCSKYKAYNKYRKALEEIREICKKETSHYDRLIEIVTKVGEVLDEQ